LQGEENAQIKIIILLTPSLFKEKGTGDEVLICKGVWRYAPTNNKINNPKNLKL
jgi:hypothetical protein